MSPLGAYVFQTLLTLVAIVALALVVLYVAKRAGIGRPSGPLELVGRLPLDGRRAVYLVRVKSTVYVLGASEAGLVKLGQLAEGELLPSEGVETRPFSDVLRQVLGRGAASEPPLESALPREPSETPAKQSTGERRS